MESEQKQEQKAKKHSEHHLIHSCGNFLYFIGFQAEYLFLKISRAVKKVLVSIRESIKWLFSLAWNLLCPFFAAIWEDLCAPWRQMRSGLQHVKEIMKAERDAGGSATGKGIAYFFHGIFVYRHLILHGLAYLMPLAALGILLVTVHSVLASTFALRVDYLGDFVGFIEKESVYDEAHTEILSRIENAGTDDDWFAQPEYTITIVDNSRLDTPATLTDRIIETSASEFREATGVYVNTELIGVTAESERLEKMIGEIKEPLEKAYEGNPDWRVEFQQDVRFKPGLYFTSTIVSLDCLMARLHGALPVRLSDGNMIEGWDMLGVQAVQSTSRVIETTLPEQIIEDPQIQWGKEIIEQNAVPGRTELFEDIIYIDGIEVQRIQTQEPLVLSEPLAKIIRRGTYNPYGGEAGEAATGRFAWPVPDYKGISRWAGVGWPPHRGVDITGAKGTLIYAADNGIVEVAMDARRMGGGLWTYGKYVKINHGNTFSTLYAHCDELLVSEGDYVVKGQPIAKMGGTGYVTGIHCHVEVQINDRWVDPKPYLIPPG